MQMDSIHIASRVDGIPGYVCRGCEDEAVRVAQEDVGGVIGYTELTRRDIKKMKAHLEKRGEETRIFCVVCGREIK